MVHQLTMIDDIDTVVSTDEEGLELKHTVHNPTIQWNLMKPIEREIYESIEQLKFALTNYAVANGHPLQFTKSNSQGLQVKCGQSQDGKTCPFSLWATQIENEKSFQIKKLIGKHICIRTNDFGPFVTSDWIAKHYINELSEKPDMKLRELKADIEKKFSCNVDMSKCYRAKKRAQALINSCIEASPLNERKMPGRISVKRKRNVYEKDDMYRTRRAVTCKNCLEKGHNVRSCKNAKRILPPKEKKKVGRPRIVKEEKVKKCVKEKNKKLRVDELPTEVPMSMLQKMIVDEVDDEGVGEIQTTIDDLKKSGYTEDEIDAILANEAQEDDDEPGIKDTPLHGDAPIEVHDDDDGVEDDDEWIEETQPLVVVKGRRPSERIIKIKLGKKVDGRGSALGTPIDIE